MIFRHFRKYGRDSGVALVSALIVVSISAGIFAAIMYFTLSGTEISGTQRKYQSAKEASLGSIEIMTKDILPRVITGTNLSAAVAGLTTIPDIVPAIVANPARDACFRSKLTSLTGDWPGGECDSGTDPTVNSDIVFNLKGTAATTRPFVVSMKIIDTVPGNSDKSGTVLELGSGTVDDASGLISVQHFPFLYTLMTDARLQGSQAERANMEVLYAY